MGRLLTLLNRHPLLPELVARFAKIAGFYRCRLAFGWRDIFPATEGVVVAIALGAYSLRLLHPFIPPALPHSWRTWADK